VQEELPTAIEAALSSMRNESRVRETASLFPDEVKSPHQKKILSLLKVDGSTHIDQRVEPRKPKGRPQKSAPRSYCWLPDLDLLSREVR